MAPFFIPFGVNFGPFSQIPALLPLLCTSMGENIFPLIPIPLHCHLLAAAQLPRQATIFRGTIARP